MSDVQTVRSAPPLAAGVRDEGVWLGPSGRPLAGRLHLPADRVVRGSAVIVPGVGHEFALGYAGARRLGQLLAAAGIAALHLHPDGVGDSWGDDTDPGRVPAWQASVDAAVSWLRDELGVDADPVLVGHRLGATLAARAAAGVGARAVVQLDPVTGREAARRFRLAAGLQRFATRPGEISADGMIVTDETLAALSGLTSVDPSCPTLVVAAGRRRDDGEQWERPEVAALTPAVTGHGQVPEPLLADVVRWLDPGPSPDRTWTVPATDPAVTVDGVRETVGRVGDLVAITTETADAHGPVVLLLTTAFDPRFGPSRLWAPWARRLAALGFPVVRADLSGVGDSPAVDGPPNPYREESLPDVRALIVGTDRGEGVALVGLCSGARNAIDAADPGGPVTDLLLLNPVLRPTRRQLVEAVFDEPSAGDGPEPPTTRMRLATPLPRGFWRAAHAAGLLDRQTRPLLRVLEGGTHAAVVYGRGDFVMLEPASHHEVSMGRLERTGRAHVVELDVDHSLLDPIGREHALQVLTDHLVARHGRP